MRKKRITVTVDADLALYLDNVPNKSRVVSEAVREYCALELERRLEEAYRDGYQESADLSAEWASTDAELEE